MYGDPNFREAGPHAGIPGVLKFFAWCAVALCGCALAVHGCGAAEAAGPDAIVRMASPSGCSGGVIHASHEHGIWIATCKHCVHRRGAPVSLQFFEDGRRSQTVAAVCVGSHPSADCAIVWCSAAGMAELPGVFPLSRSPVRDGQVVYAAGSFAGGTIAPASRKLMVTRVTDDGWGFDLSDAAWHGHSGGPVIDARTGELVGVLWGMTTSGPARKSLVTSNRALWATLYPRTRQTGQAFYSVSVETADIEPVARLQVTVCGSDMALRRFRATVAESHLLREHIDWIERRSGGPVRFEWGNVRASRPKTWQLDHWPGETEFLGYLARTGIHLQCPGGNCRPRRGGNIRDVPEVPEFDIFGGRNDDVPPYVEPPPRNDESLERLERLESLIGRLVELEDAPPAEPKPAEPDPLLKELLDRQGTLMERLLEAREEPDPPLIEDEAPAGDMAATVAESTKRFDAARKSLRIAGDTIETVLAGEPVLQEQPAEQYAADEPTQPANESPEGFSLDEAASEPTNWLMLLALGLAGFALKRNRETKTA